MLPEDIAGIIRSSVPKQFLIDAVKQIRVRFAGANELVKTTDLNSRRGKWAEGTFRFLSVEQGFEEVGVRHGGENLQYECVPGSEALIYQTFFKFDGVIIGFAMHREPGTLPTKNQTRGGAVQLNLPFSSHLKLGVEPSEPGEIYVALLASRDQAVAGAVRAIEIAVIDPSYDHFLFCQSIETFIAGYPDSPEESAPVATALTDPRTPLVRLRDPKPFAPPGAVPDKGADKDAEDGAS